MNSSINTKFYSTNTIIIITGKSVFVLLITASEKHKNKGNTKCHTSSQSLTPQGLLSLSKHPCF